MSNEDKFPRGAKRTENKDGKSSPPTVNSGNYIYPLPIFRGTILN